MTTRPSFITRSRPKPSAFSTRATSSNRFGEFSSIPSRVFPSSRSNSLSLLSLHFPESCSLINSPLKGTDELESLLDPTSTISLDSSRSVATLRPFLPSSRARLTSSLLPSSQLELQKSREAAAELHSLQNAMNEVHDTLGGGNVSSLSLSSPSALLLEHLLTNPSLLSSSPPSSLPSSIPTTLHLPLVTQPPRKSTPSEPRSPTLSRSSARTSLASKPLRVDSRTRKLSGWRWRISGRDSELSSINTSETTETRTTTETIRGVLGR